MAISWNGSLWIALTVYAVGARAVNGANVYVVTITGISAGAGGPAGTGAAIVDGSVTWAYLGAYTGCVLDVAPELATGTPTITPSMQGVFLRLAETLVADPSVWGALLDDGRRYLAAHLGELARLRGVGPVTSQAVGPISQSNAALMHDSALMLTTCGRFYMDLIRTTPATLGLVV